MQAKLPQVNMSCVRLNKVDEIVEVYFEEFHAYIKLTHTVTSARQAENDNTK